MAREDFLDNELGQYIDSKLQNLGFESKSNQVLYIISFKPFKVNFVFISAVYSRFSLFVG